MKTIKVIIGIVVAAVILSSCTQKHCPTYADSIDESEELFV